MKSSQTPHVLNANPDITQPEQAGPCFSTTRWNLVLAAGKSATATASVALEELCRIYWYPLYAYIRRQGYTKEDAEDLTQSFFMRFLEKNNLEHLRPEQGKFRCFLLVALKHFLANEWDRSQRQKRGGGAPVLSLDWQTAASRYQLDPPDYLSPDILFDRAWAMTLMERVIQQLEQESVAEGKAELFTLVKPFLMLERTTIPYQQTARQLRVTEGALRVVVHRLRRRYRELLRQEIAHTVSDPQAVQEEIHALFAAFAN